MRSPLVGDSPYADSKIKAEEYLTNWCKEHNVILGILRPSLLAGKGAPGNLGAMVNGIRTGAYLSIAGGKARKSVLMVDDIAHLVPLVAEKGGVYNVCDDNNPSFGFADGGRSGASVCLCRSSARRHQCRCPKTR